MGSMAGEGRCFVLLVWLMAQAGYWQSFAMWTQSSCGTCLACYCCVIEKTLFAFPTLATANSSVNTLTSLVV